MKLIKDIKQRWDDHARENESYLKLSAVDKVREPSFCCIGRDTAVNILREAIIELADKMEKHDDQ